MKCVWEKPLSLILVLFLAFSFAGLNSLHAAYDNTTQTTTVKDGDTTTTTTDTTVVKEVKVKEEHSIVGSLFVFIGEVVSFPFRMIGKAFDAIF